MSEATPLFGFDFSTLFTKVPLVKNCFRGVYSVDRLPRTLKVREFIICNLSKHNESGSHWIVICRSHRKTFEIFNSLGYTNLDELKFYIKFRIRADYEFNSSSFQTPDSVTCGHFCVFFACHRVLNYDCNLKHVLEDIFVPDLNINENRVISFYNKLLRNENDDDLFDD